VEIPWTVVGLSWHQVVVHLDHYWHCNVGNSRYLQVGFRFFAFCCENEFAVVINASRPNNMSAFAQTYIVRNCSEKRGSDRDKQKRKN